MKRMKTIGTFLIALIILSSTLAGDCFTKRYSPDMVMMFTQVFHAVPGGRGYDSNVIKGEVKETDEYGRIRFSFWTGDIEGVCIMQKHDEKYVYYYENVSYLIKEQYRNHTTEELEAFNKANDWNEPMKEDRIIKRELVKSTLSPNRESAIDWQVAKRAFYQTIDENGYTTGTGYFDYSQTGQEIFLMRRYERVNREDNSYLELIDCHLMILNADGTYDPENYLLKIDDLSQSNAPLAEIKERNGWVG